MDINTIKLKIKDIVKNIVDKNFELIYKNDYLKQMTIEQLSEIVSSYEGEFTMPPENSFEKFVIYVIAENEVSIDFSLWHNKQESDITLICRLKKIDGNIEYSIEDLHVM